MGNGLICKLFNYCPAPLAPDNAPKVEDSQNKTVKRQLTVEQAKALPIIPNCNGIDKVLDKNDIKRITVEEPMNQPAYPASKSVILTVEENPTKNSSGAIVQATHYCSHEPNNYGSNSYEPLSVINYTSENPVTVEKTVDIGTSGAFGSSHIKTTTEPGQATKELEKAAAKLGGVTIEVDRKLGTKYKYCSFGRCRPESKDDYEKYGETQIPHFVDGKLVRE